MNNFREMLATRTPFQVLLMLLIPLLCLTGFAIVAAFIIGWVSFFGR